MEVKLDNKDSLITVFALPVLGAALLMAAVWEGHCITRAQPPTPVTVTAAPPRIDVNVPQAAAPRVEVTAMSQPAIEVNVPASNPAAVNITAPQPLVTILDRRDADRPESKKEVVPIVPVKAHSEAPSIPEPVQVQIQYKDKPTDVTFKTEDLTIETLFQYAERYIDSYCLVKHLDPSVEAVRWNREWRQKLETAIADGSVNDEQGYMNRVIVEKRDCLNLEQATPEKIVEGCRLMLRYRDGKLTLLKAMKDQVTGDNLRKSLVFLAAGVK